ncbi:MAG: glycosyltransferase [Acidobacteriota bacterium]
MHLLVISHKRCWRTPQGVVATGGFPRQMEALAQLCQRLVVAVPLQPTPVPAGAQPLRGESLEVLPLREPWGRGPVRKAALAPWLALHGPKLWRALGEADGVHALVPGDIGTLGLLLAQWRRKPLLVRHCGTWGLRTTAADRFLARRLPRIAGGRTVVLATGAGEGPPPPGGEGLHWIFSTSLWRREMEELPTADPWCPGSPLRLITVGRLSHGKNALAAVRAVAMLRDRKDHEPSLPEVHLEILGDGEARSAVEEAIRELHLQSRVLLRGNVGHDEVLQALARSHLFVFPTRVAEGFPKAVLEALAAGLPVLAPAVSALPHLLAPDAAGVAPGALLKNTAESSVAAAVAEWIRAGQQDSETFARSGRLARQRAHSYSLEAWRDAIAERLREAWK